MKQEGSTTRRDLLALLAALGVTGEALAQDPVASDPRSFRIVLENDRVRVLEYRSGPGLGVCGQGLHYHPERVTVTLTEAKVRIANAEGRTVVRELPAGQVFYAPAETHSVENVGGSGTRIYIIELKGRDWRPSSGV
jgi:beta-alanine degradation protein BauB